MIHLRQKLLNYHRRGSLFFQEVFKGGDKEEKSAKIKWRGRKRSILTELDRLHRTLVHTGPAFDAFFSMGWIRFVHLNLIDLAGADLNAVSTTFTFLLVHNGIHISNAKSQRA
jgi:hypothetical protein